MSALALLPASASLGLSVAVLVMALAAGFHFYWGLGGQFGRSVSVPTQRDGHLKLGAAPGGARIFEPSAAATHAVGITLTLAIVILLATAGIVQAPLPRTWLRVATAGIGLVFLARGLSWHTYIGLFKEVRDTRFGRYDTRFFSPLCVVVALSLYLLLSGT